ncbi:MAG: hypothetical protein J3Q66DRAFT_403189 [Benniella sp.]|nr:MAG: hypothetical protein J3Q66DRAFT_403189 [Benniella sp.]
MKFSASILALAVIASQAVLAKPSTPVAGCTKLVKVENTDSTCNQFAKRNHIDFKALRKLNNGLHSNCDNLDKGVMMCVEKLTPTPAPAETTPAPPTAPSNPSNPNQLNKPNKSIRPYSLNRPNRPIRPIRPTSKSIKETSTESTTKPGKKTTPRPGKKTVKPGKKTITRPGKKTVKPGKKRTQHPGKKSIKKPARKPTHPAASAHPGGSNRGTSQPHLPKM